MPTKPCLHGRTPTTAWAVWLCAGCAAAVAQSPVPPCQSDRQIGTRTYASSQTVAAPNYISASGVVTAGPGINVLFQAGTSICFGPGFDFSAANGGTLTSVIAALTTLSVGGPPSLPNGITNQYYGPIAFAATGGSGGYAWSLSNGPPGLSIGATDGQLGGFPATAGQYPNLTVTVTDAVANMTRSKTLPLTVTVSSGTLAITTVSLPGGTVGTAYSQPLTATGGSGTGYSWSWAAASGSSLPGGLNLSGTGLASGTPTTPGSYVANVALVDSVGNTASKNLMVAIGPGGGGSSLSGNFKEYIRSGIAIIAIEQSSETVSRPSSPSGPPSGLPGMSYTYSTGGSTDSAGAGVQYQFNWGDGTSSMWLPVGTSSTSHSWVARSSPYSVTAQARSASSPTVTSPVSSALAVSIQTGSAIPVLVQMQNMGTSGSYEYYTAIVRDNAGASDLQEVDFWFSGTGADCHFAYFPSANLVYIDRPALGNLWVDHGTPGALKDLNNGICDIPLASFTFNASGTDLTMSPTVYFLAAGAYNVKLSATSGAGTAGYTSYGSVTIPPYAHLYIDSGTYHSTDMWTLTLYTNFPNTPVSLCGIFNGTTLGCETEPYPTDANGFWTRSAFFTPTVIGSWQEWAQLSFNGSNVTSNSVSFTVTQ